MESGRITHKLQAKGIVKKVKPQANEFNVSCQQRSTPDITQLF